MRYCVCLAALCLIIPVQAQNKEKEKPLYEIWQAAYLEGMKIGHGHILCVNAEVNGQKVIRTTRITSFTVKRYESALPVHREEIVDEDADGKVLYMETTFTLGKDKNGPIKGTVSGKELMYSSPQLPKAVKLPYSEDVTGPYHQEYVFAKKKVKPGDTFEVTTYELLVPAALKMAVAVKDEEVTDRLLLKKNSDKIEREAVRLRRVDVKPGKLKFGDREVQLPGLTRWLDENGMPVRERFEMPGAGAITMYATTKEAALKEGVAPELLPDLGLRTVVHLKTSIDKPYETKQVVYRVTTAEPIDKVFAESTRQKVGKKQDNNFELVIKTEREPGKDEKAEKPGPEYLESNQFINSDDKHIQSLMQKVVENEKDSWAKAKKIEKWVHDNMKFSTAVGFPAADKIAKDLEGDCRQHALLTVAMCRAAGVPARTAIGLVYAHEDGKRNPMLGFHMWAEVWVRGKWLGLDATLGQGGIAATHLKMSDHSWAKTVTLAPLLPVAETLGKLKIEVVEAK